MPLFQSTTHSQEPAEKRISLPASQRLTTITEGQNVNSDTSQTPPPIPRRSSRRNSASSPRRSRRWSGSSNDGSSKTAPPPYDWISEPTDSRGDSGNTVEDEKLAWLRRGEGDRKRRRGGWVRLAVIIGVVLLMIIGLAVGLGVGLSRKKKASTEQKGQNAQDAQNQPSTQSLDNPPPQKFPLGEYSMVTALMTLEAGCTANPATWRCWPYVVFSPSTNESSMASFNWIINNSSSVFATSESGSTPDGGMPANLTVSTSNNPFDVTFTDKELTYISSSNTVSARYTFSFTMSKQVDPLIALTQDNSATTCFYKETVYTGTLYLSKPRKYPPGNLADSKALGGYEQWPYAVEVTQTAYGGTDVPSCYKTVDGKLGDRVSGLAPMASTSECVCDYKNF